MLYHMAVFESGSFPVVGIEANCAGPQGLQNYVKMTPKVFAAVIG